MAESQFTRFYRRADFIALTTPGIDLPLLKTWMAELVLDTPFVDVQLLTTEVGARVDWQEFASPEDVALVDARIAAFVGGATTSEPFELESSGATQSTSAAPVLKATLGTGPLDAGTYTFSWNSLIRMNPAGANSGVKGLVRISRSDGVFREQPDSWDLTADHAFNGNLIFKVSAGQTLTATAHVWRLGAAGTAEMLSLRFTIDQLAPAPA